MADDKMKYTLDNLANDLDRSPASIRASLRRLEIEKEGKSYGWKNQTDYNAVLKQLKSDDAPAAKEKPVAKKAVAVKKPGKAKADAQAAA